MTDIDREYLRALEHYIHDDAVFSLERGTGHPCCPWCGGEMRLEWGKNNADIWCLTPACIICGFESITSFPIPEGKEGFDALDETKQKEIRLDAWRAHDTAWWTKRNEDLLEKLESIRHDLIDFVTSLELTELTKAK